MITPVAYDDRHDARRARRTAPARGSLNSFDPATGAEFERNHDWWGGATPLDGSVGASSTTRARWSRPRRPARSTRSSSSRSSAATRCSTTPTSTSSASRPPPTARSGCAATQGQFADKRVRQALGYSIDRQALVDTLFKGKADIGNDHVIAPIYPFFDPSVPQRRVRHRRCQGAARRGRVPRRPVGRAPLRQPAGDPRARPADPGPGGRGRLHARARRREPRHVLRRRSGARPSRPTRRARAPPSSASSTTATAPRLTCTSTPRSRRAASGTRRSTRRPSSTPPSPSTRRRSASRRRRRRARRSRRSCSRTRRSSCRTSTTTSRAARTKLHRRPGLGARPDVPRPGRRGLSRCPTTQGGAHGAPPYVHPGDGEAPMTRYVLRRLSRCRS